MGGRATFSGTDFQARVGAYFAALILARQKIPPYGVRRGLLSRIWYEQPSDAGDDIRLETGDGLVYEVQAKHGLRGDAKLAEAIEQFASRLASDRFGILVVDRTSTSTITRELREAFNSWRNGQEPDLSNSLRERIAPLLASGKAELRKRLVVAVMDLDDDDNADVLRAVDLLGRHLVDPDRAEHAWSALIKIVSHGSKRGYSHDRARLAERLADEGCEVTADERIAVSVASPRSEAPLAEVGADVPAELRPIAKLIDRIRPKAALDALGALVTNDATTDKERAQRLTLRGAALLQLEDGAAARPVLEEAVARAPDYVPAILNLAIAEGALGNEARAHELIRSATTLAPENARTWAARLHLVGDVTRDAVPAALRDDRVVLIAAGAAALRRGEPADAIAPLEAALAASPEFDPQCAHLLAVALELLAQRAVAPADGDLRRRALGLLDEILARVEEVSAGVRKTAVWNRAIVLEALGEPERALHAYRDLVRAGAATPELAARYAQRALASKRDLPDALHLIEEVVAERPNEILGALRVRLLRGLGEAARARAELYGLAARALAGDINVEECVAIASAAIELDDAATAGSALDRLAPDARDVRVHVLRARAAILAERHDDARREYAAAIEVVDAEDERAIRLEYAAFLRAQKRFPEVVEALTPVANTNDERVLRTLVEVCYAAREFSKAEAFAARAGEGVWWAARTLAFIAMMRQDLARAEGHFARWRTLEPEHIEPSLWLAELRLQRGDAARAIEALAEIDAAKLTPIDRIRLGYLWFRADEVRRALDVAFEALRVGHDDNDVLRGFFQIAVQAGQRLEYTPPDVAGVGVSVTLRTAAGEEYVYLITAGAAPVTPIGELAATDPLAERLIGKRRGDSVVFRAAPPQEAAEVVDLADHHAHAARWAAAEVERRDPSSSMIRSFRVIDDEGNLNIEPLLEVQRANAAHDARVLDEAQRKPLPLGFVATMLGRSVIDAYARFANDEARTLPVEETDPEPAIVAAIARRFVLTRTALLTLETIGALDALETPPCHLLATPALLEQLRRERDEHADVARSGRRAIGLSPGGRPVLHETAPEVGRALMEAHERLEAWVRDRCITVLPDAPASRSDVWEHLVPEAEEAVLVAAQSNAVLLTDDLGLRRLAHFTMSVQGASTFALLSAMRRAQSITEEVFAQRVVHLLGLGHGALPMDADHLLLAIRHDPAQLRVFHRVLGQLRAPHNDGVMVARFLVRLLRLVALEAVLAVGIATIADLCFEAVLGPRPEHEARLADALQRTIGNEFLLLPVQGERLLAQLAQYRAVRRGGIRMG